jgi:hypothetical protein
LAFELLVRFLLIIHAAFYGLTVSETGGAGNIEFATPRNIKFRHLVRLHRGWKIQNPGPERPPNR